MYTSGLIFSIFKERMKSHVYQGKSFRFDCTDSHLSQGMILEADTGEENAFDLVSWYESYDFNIIERENAYPLMMKVLD